MSDKKFGSFGGITLKPSGTEPIIQQPKRKPDENLTGALRASLEIISNSDLEPSPLLEAIPNSIDELWDRINNHMIEGKILDDDLLRKTIDLYRSQALRWSQEQETKKPRQPRSTKPVLTEVLDLKF